MVEGLRVMFAHHRRGDLSGRAGRLAGDARGTASEPVAGFHVFGIEKAIGGGCAAGVFHRVQVKGRCRDSGHVERVHGQYVRVCSGRRV